MATTNTPFLPTGPHSMPLQDTPMSTSLRLLIRECAEQRKADIARLTVRVKALELAITRIKNAKRP